jgi:hypothetical protein
LKDFTAFGELEKKAMSKSETNPKFKCSKLKKLVEDKNDKERVLLIGFPRQTGGIV